MVNYIDLFAGIGGIRIGVDQALAIHNLEGQCVLSSEIDENACETYKLNFGEYPSGDIHLIDEIPNFDLLLAGFPCQPFSYAGKQMGFGDTRGTLFFEIERILGKYHPKAFLLENVRGLYTHDQGRTFSTICEKLHQLGYGTYDMLLNSSDFGVPQNRVRLYILGLKGATPRMNLKTTLGAYDSHVYKNKRQQISIWSEEKPNVVASILEDDVSDEYYCSDLFESQLHHVVGEDLSKLHGYRLTDYRGGQSIHSWDLAQRGECSEAEIRFMNLLIQNRRKPIFGKHQDGKKLTIDQIKTFYLDDDLNDVVSSLISKGYLKEEGGRYNPVCGNMSFEVFKFLDPDSISITLTSSDANRLGIIQNNRARRITPRECARLQGFPDSYILHPKDNAAYKQLGNSVAIPVIRAVIDDFICNNYDFLEWE